MNCEKVRIGVNPEMRSRVDQLLGPGNFRVVTSGRRNGANGRNQRRSG
jgi:hypothetical protein